MKSYKATARNALDLPTGTFTYNAVAIKPFPDNCQTYPFVVSASDNSLTWIGVAKEPLRTTIKVLRRETSVHTLGLTCLQSLDSFSSSNVRAPTVVSAGRDGYIKIWGADAGDPLMMFRTPNMEGISAIAHYANVQSKSYIAAGTELESQGPGDVAIFIWSIPDTTTQTMEHYNQPILAIVESHTDTITNLIFRSLPTKKLSTTDGRSLIGDSVRLISSSTDGLINFIDPSIEEEEDAILTVLNNKSAVQYCQPFGESNHCFSETGYVCAISQDEKLSVHAIAQSTNEQEASDPQTLDLREVYKCDYSIGLKHTSGGDEWFRQNGASHTILALGACKEETTREPHVDLYAFIASQVSNQQPNLAHAVRLHGGHGQEIVRDIWFRDNIPFILTCGEDGCVKVWEESRSNNQKAVLLTTEECETPPMKHRKSKNGAGGLGIDRDGTKKRFKPY